MRKVVATALGLAAGAFAVGAALAGSKPAPRRPATVPPPRRMPDEPAPRAPQRREAARTAPAANPGEVPYSVNPAALYGPYHRNRRPVGLPALTVEASGDGERLILDGFDEAATRRDAIQLFAQRFRTPPAVVRTQRVRPASTVGAALRPIAEQAARHGLGDAFVKTMTHLAKTEGEGGTFAVPARTFVAACTTRSVHPRRLCTPVDAPRNGARQLITAWGVFQWNRDAGRELKALDGLGVRAPFVPDDWMPWDWTAAEEIAIPINYYAQLWALVRRHGGSERDAARGARLWHVGPSYFRAYLRSGAGAAAWTNVDAEVSRRIDKHLKNAGVA